MISNGLFVDLFRFIIEERVSLSQIELGVNMWWILFVERVLYL